jgi:hypothetical protein
MVDAIECSATLPQSKADTNHQHKNEERERQAKKEGRNNKPSLFRQKMPFKIGLEGRQTGCSPMHA